MAENSRIFGVNAEINYYFNPQLAVGLGVGYEKLTQPSIIYYPVYLNIMGMLTENKKTIYVKLNFGTHFGDIEKSRFLFRSGLGIRFKISKNILPILELTYSYQNINKTFQNSNRPDNYYNMESIGLSLGFELN